MIPELGVIEGYVGRPWRHEDRKQVLSRLREMGYAWFHYAPKADAWLRRRWRERHPDAVLAELSDLSAHCRGLGMRFGVGLSPYELYRDFSGDAMRAFVDKVRSLDAIGIDDLAILFDDTRGDVPDLAAREAEIVHAAIANTRASRVLMCPTYYSDDRMLDVVFGERPRGYLQDLGRRLDPAIGVYWTGEEICTREFSPGHLTRVAEALGRKPTLWDNYPVNDGSKASSFLHLRAFENRPAELAELTSGHAVNPMKQAALSVLPLATLPMSYKLGKQYDPDKALHASLNATCGPQISAMIQADLPLFQDIGLAQLTPEQVAHLKARYLPFRDQACVGEILLWLDGEYVFDPDCLTD